MSEGLTPEQLAELAADLKKLQAELTRLLADEGNLGGTVELDQSTMGRLSRMDAMQQQAMAQATLRRHEQRLERIASALERIDDDEDFGWCPDCGEAIAWRRLKAVPDSFLCVGCQSARGR